MIHNDLCYSLLHVHVRIVSGVYYTCRWAMHLALYNIYTYIRKGGLLLACAWMSDFKVQVLCLYYIHVYG